MSHWNYRVIKKHFESPYEKEFRYGIHEAYYDDEGRIISISVEPMDPHGDTPEELAEDMKYMALALEKPILDYETACDPNATDFGMEAIADLNIEEDCTIQD